MTHSGHGLVCEMKCDTSFFLAKINELVLLVDMKSDAFRFIQAGCNMSDTIEHYQIVYIRLNNKMAQIISWDDLNFRNENISVSILISLKYISHDW